MNLSDLTGRPVLDLATATDIGEVEDFVIDPTTRRIVGFHLANVTGPTHWLSWELMTTLGPDALTIESSDILTEPPEHSRGLRADKVFGGRVLTDTGRELANLIDLELDPNTGQITAIAIGDKTLGADALIGTGRYATIVVDPEK